jgi:hypothetical protein
MGSSRQDWEEMANAECFAPRSLPTAQALRARTELREAQAVAERRGAAIERIESAERVNLSYTEIPTSRWPAKERAAFVKELCSAGYSVQEKAYSLFVTWTDEGVR